MDLKTDVTPDYDRLALGRVKFFVIERENRFGVRVKDNDSEARKKFAGLRWYPVDPSWKIKAKFIPSPHQVTFDTEVGVKEKDDSPGYVTFTRGGQEYKMEPVKEDDDLWFVFRDQTSGKTTYGGVAVPVHALPQGRLRRDRLQQGRESALRVHRLRDLPSADSAEPSAACGDGRRADVPPSAMTLSDAAKYSAALLGSSGAHRSHVGHPHRSGQGRRPLGCRRVLRHRSSRSRRLHGAGGGVGTCRLRAARHSTSDAASGG